MNKVELSAYLERLDGALKSRVQDTDLLLWSGSRLTIKTVAIPHLVASKLIRYDEIDRSDVQYLSKQGGVEWRDVAAAVELLPPPFDRDTVVRENLNNLKVDMAIWKDDRQ